MENKVAYNDENKCIEENNTMRDFKSFVPIATAFQMEHLLEMCCGDLDLVSNVLETFCVQGRQRLEKMESILEKEDLGEIVFEAVRYFTLSKIITLHGVFKIIIAHFLICRNFFLVQRKT